MVWQLVYVALQLVCGDVLPLLQFFRQRLDGKVFQGLLGLKPIPLRRRRDMEDNAQCLCVLHHGVLGFAHVVGVFEDVLFDDVAIPSSGACATRWTMWQMMRWVQLPYPHSGVASVSVRLTWLGTLCALGRFAVSAGCSAARQTIHFVKTLWQMSLV